MVDAMNILKATYVDSVTREMYDDAISERDDARRESEQRAKDAEKLVCILWSNYIFAFLLKYVGECIRAKCRSSSKNRSKL